MIYLQCLFLSQRLRQTILHTMTKKTQSKLEMVVIPKSTHTQKDNPTMYFHKKICENNESVNGRFSGCWTVVCASYCVKDEKRAAVSYHWKLHRCYWSAAARLIPCGLHLDERQPSGKGFPSLFGTLMPSWHRWATKKIYHNNRCDVLCVSYLSK